MDRYDAAMEENLPEAVTKAWARLVKAQARALQAVETDLKTAGFPPLAWYDVLLELKQEDAGLRPFELESRLLLAQHNVSRLIDRMQAKNLVERKPCGDDGRGQLVAVTAEGRAMQRKMWPAYRASIQRHVGAKLTETEASKLAALLQRLL
jgi:DNA-binding MarR family transcriptional regulator